MPVETPKALTQSPKPNPNPNPDPDPDPEPNPRLSTERITLTDQLCRMSSEPPVKSPMTALQNSLFDTDGDGVVDDAEMLAGMHALMAPVSRDRLCNDLMNTSVMAALIGGFALNR